MKRRWLEVVVEHWNLDRLLPRWRLPKDGTSPVFFNAIDVSAFDDERFVRQPDEPLDVIGRWLLRILEDWNVPPLRVAELIRELVNQNPIALKDRSVSYVILESAVRTNGRLDAFVRTEVAGLVVNLVAGTDQYVVAALFAVGFLVATVQCRRHRAGWNDEGFRFETSEQKGQHKCNDNRFDCLTSTVLLDPLLTVIRRFLPVSAGLLPGRFRRFVFLWIRLPRRTVF